MEGFSISYIPALNSTIDHLTSIIEPTGTILLILEIPSLPALNKIRPGCRVEDIHRGYLALVNGSVGYIAELDAGCLAAVAGNGFEEDTAFGFAGVLTGDLDIIIGNFSVHKITGKLLRGRARFDDRGGKINGIGNHKLDHAVLIPFK